MALVIKDRVKETTTTTGTGTYTLAGAVSGFETFTANLSNSDTTYYVCTDNTDFEVGLGTFTSSGTTLARTTILASSNSNNEVNWSSGTRTIFMTYPADKAVFKDASNNINGTFVGDITGNADTATTLETARTINGTSFNGGANITVTAAAGTLTGSTLNSGVTASSLTSLGTLASNLNLGGQDIVTTTSNQDIDLQTHGTGKVVIKGNTDDSGSNPGAIKLNCEANSHGQTLKAAPHSESATNTITLPSSGGDARLVTTSSTATLTNKTLTTPVIAEIDNSSDITLDAGADIILDAGGGDFNFKVAGTEILRVTNSSSDVIIRPVVDAKDIIFQQRDGTEVARVEDNGTFNIVTDKLAINGTAVTSTAAELNILDGVTSTASELNILDGVTSTATELNVMDGGTSATSTTLVDADRLVTNDAGTMKQVALTDVKTYLTSAGFSTDDPTALAIALG